MEIAVSIQSINDMELLDSPWNFAKLTTVEQETCNSFYKAMVDSFGEQLPKRVYFGSEFCHYRLPKPKELIEAFNMAREKGYKFTLVTPSIPQSSIGALESMINELANHIKQNHPSLSIEVVCNDWGILHYVKTAYPNTFTPVLGRLLNKLIRDPRVTQHYNRLDAPRIANTQLKQASYTVHYYRNFIKAANVKIIEFDNFSQGIEPESSIEEFQTSMHFGYGCIATGRTCLVGSMHVKESEKFRGEVICKQQCQHYTAEMVNRHPRIDSMQHRVFQKGNSAFYQQTYEQMLEGLQSAKEKNIHRIVYSPRIPV